MLDSSGTLLNAMGAGANTAGRNFSEADTVVVCGWGTCKHNINVSSTAGKCCRRREGYFLLQSLYRDDQNIFKVIFLEIVIN